MKVSYRIVWQSRHEEIFTVECDTPEVAVRAYVEAMVKAGACGARVYPAEDKPLMEVGTQPQKVGSKLFDGYDQPKNPGCCGGKKCPSWVEAEQAPWRAKFKTDGSSWIREVSWEARNRTICVHFLRGGYIVYVSDYLTFENFKMWVEAGGSAGEYYNKNIKGLTVLKRG